MPSMMKRWTEKLEPRSEHPHTIRGKPFRVRTVISTKCYTEEWEESCARQASRTAHAVADHCVLMPHGGWCSGDLGFHILFRPPDVTALHNADTCIYAHYKQRPIILHNRTFISGETATRVHRTARIAPL